ncbi:toxin-antitoxin system toxin RelE/ParE family protein [Rhizobium phaseoli]|uniref:type II toxin-antitoxin system RelE/ParE family toxin n=1 Tax=Rhizobium phaseoli TaxID=396 RepID=UPI0007EA15B7|nr:type II toxin-antitoxin system RelE/ParE family toxin [Rhizobium phaseoli]ANL44980.1 toxin-antitoxin system toxin RelE/ParE family protein [Rhizobium phaseoli]PDS28964.1 type II toxin-antitoxin system RelE/ParE family toxin [Rhizobium phaseoli]
MGFRLTQEAEEDIIGIAETGILLFGSAHARRYHHELYAIFDLIAANPRMARERDEISPPTRIHPFKAHLVVYTIVEGDHVLIVRIRHGHEDWSSQA